MTMQATLAAILLFAVANAADNSTNSCGDAYCSSHGSLVLSGSLFVCQCDKGYSGSKCDQLNTPEYLCGVELCNSHGILVPSGSGYICQCQTPYAGLQCGQLACANGGVYKDGACVCTGNFYGQLCEKSCPNNFELLKDAKTSSPVGCYNFVTSQKKFDDANANCPKVNPSAYLVVINTAAENTAIKTRLNTVGSCTSQFYTSGQRQPINDCQNGVKKYNFVWKPSGKAQIPLTTSDFNDWGGTAEPNCGGGTESCLTFYNVYQWAWNDSDCGVTLCSVCEVDL